ncbi:hypothetical protein KQI52_16690 [bacterium]|nr:hypothetical protein [bacterium]
MEQGVDVSAVRRKALISHMSDGIFELYIGCSLTCIGIFEVLQHFGYGDGATAVTTPVYVIFPLFMVVIFKRTVTRKRIGYVDFRHSRHKINMLHLGLVWVIALALFALVVLLQNTIGADPAAEGWKEQIKPFLGLYLAIWIAVVISTVAVMGEAHKWHIGSIFFLVVYGLLYLLNIHISWGFLICGGALLIYGSIQLTRFLRDNPVLPPVEYEGPVHDA